VALEHPLHQVKIAFVGKYVDLTESYKSLIEAIKHAGIHTRSEVEIVYLDSEDIERDGCGVLKAWMPSWCPAVLADGVRKARLLLFAMPVKTRCLILVFALACNWQWSSLPGMSPA
jgi:hypothetical protein